jgi:hypothetical protein
MTLNTHTTASLDIRLNEQLLIECVRANPDLARIRELLERPDFVWAPFWTLAGEQHVQPLVGHVLSDSTLPGSLPDEARHATRAARLQTTINNMATHAELDAVVTLLSQHSIPSVTLKGTYLAERLFSSLDARRCGDIDILVPEEDWHTARRLLEDAGYEPAATVNPGVLQHAFHDVPLVRVAHGRAFIVELHRQLTDPRSVTIDYQNLWQRVANEGVRSGNLVGLPPAELLVFLAIHAPKHDTGVMRLLADIDHLISREEELLDWQYAVALARTWHADAILYFVLTLSASLLRTPVPDDVLDAIRPPRWKRALVPLLAGPNAILRPPMPVHLRANRFKIAHCLMLRRGKRVLRSYWRSIMMPPAHTPDSPLAGAAQAVSRPVEGLIWTALAFGSAMRDRLRIGGPPQPRSGIRPAGQRGS